MEHRKKLTNLESKLSKLLSLKADHFCRDYNFGKN